MANSTIRPCAVDHCRNLVTDPHHRKQLSEGGKNTVANMMPLCRRHHEWAHDNIAKAHDLGIIIFSWEDDPTEELLSVRIKPMKEKPKRVQDENVTNEISSILKREMAG